MLPGMRFRRTHTISVPLPPDRALPLFTARGERAWVPGWDPAFPDGEPAAGEPEEEGTLFVTAHGDTSTVWVVAARRDDGVRYARTTPGHTCGTVDVRIRAATAERTDLDITYDLTALTPEAAHALQHFAAGFATEIGGWEAAIAAASG
jgi:hypothetical protein